MPQYDRIPEKMQNSAKAYVERGKLPGHFLTAILRNSLVDAVGRADMQNKQELETYVDWLYNDIPHGCWGGVEEVENWCEMGGLEGMKKDNE